MSFNTGVLYIMNSIGPRTDPCGTPYSNLSDSHEDSWCELFECGQLDQMEYFDGFPLWF